MYCNTFAEEYAKINQKVKEAQEKTSTDDRSSDDDDKNEEEEEGRN